VEWLYDGAFAVRIGGPEGPNATDMLASWQEAEIWLRLMAMELYPTSKFAKAQRQREKPLE
jgi:hypothetical protein